MPQDDVKIVIEKQLCGQCGLCSGVCPELAIVLHGWGLENENGKCTGCGRCVTVCPTGALSLKTDQPLAPSPMGKGNRRG